MRSVGGKLGVDFQRIEIIRRIQLKPEAVLIRPNTFLETLQIQRNFSIRFCWISSLFDFRTSLFRKFDIQNWRNSDGKKLIPSTLLRSNLKFETEGTRKEAWPGEKSWILDITIGHAFETYYLDGQSIGSTSGTAISRRNDLWSLAFSSKLGAFAAEFKSISQTFLAVYGKLKSSKKKYPSFWIFASKTKKMKAIRWCFPAVDVNWRIDLYVSVSRSRN